MASLTRLHSLLSWFRWCHRCLLLHLLPLSLCHLSPVCHLSNWIFSSAHLLPACFSTPLTLTWSDSSFLNVFGRSTNIHLQHFNRLQLHWLISWYRLIWSSCRSLSYSLLLLSFCSFRGESHQDVHAWSTHHHVLPIRRGKLWRRSDRTSFWETEAGMGVSFTRCTFHTGTETYT